MNLVKLKDTDIYKQRLLVFVEASPNSDIYHQVIISDEQLKKISDIVFNVVGYIAETDREIGRVRISEEEYKLPDLRETYDESDLE